jgi:hypothetical protein
MGNRAFSTLAPADLMARHISGIAAAEQPRVLLASAGLHFGNQNKLRASAIDADLVSLEFETVSDEMDLVAYVASALILPLMCSLNYLLRELAGPKGGPTIARRRCSVMEFKPAAVPSDLK